MNVNIWLSRVSVEKIAIPTRKLIPVHGSMTINQQHTAYPILAQVEPSEKVPYSTALQLIVLLSYVTYEQYQVDSRIRLEEKTLPFSNQLLFNAVCFGYAY